MTDEEKRWIELQFYYLIKDMWDCTGTMEGTNNFVSLIADTIRMDENEKKILIRFANNVLKMDYLRPIFKEEYVLLAYGKVTQNCIAARINCTQPYVKMFYDKAKKEHIEFKSILEDNEAVFLQNYINAAMNLKKEFLKEYDPYSRNAKRICSIRREWFRNESLRPVESDPEVEQY